MFVIYQDLEYFKFNADKNKSNYGYNGYYETENQGALIKCGNP